MKNQEMRTELEKQWDCAIERATLENAREQELDAMLNHSAGLSIKSGVNAGGLWGVSDQCSQGCTHIC